MKRRRRLQVDTPQDVSFVKKPIQAQRDPARQPTIHLMPTGHISPDHTLALQRTIGNQATQQLLRHATPKPRQIQRLPQRRDIVNQIGEPKADTKDIFGKVHEESTRYKFLLSEVDDYHTFITSADATPQSLTKLIGIYQSLHNVISQYIRSKGKGEKTEYFQGLLAQIAAERVQAAKLLQNRLLQNGNTNPLPWSMLFQMVQAPSTNTTVINDADVVGTNKGGTHTVEEAQVGGKHGYFKENVNEIPVLSVLDSLSGDKAKKALKGTSFEKMGRSQIDNSFYVPEAAGMFDSSQLPDRSDYKGTMAYYKKHGATTNVNLRLAQRDVAAARLDQLLNAGVVANAELAYRNTGNKMIEGSFMEAAVGEPIDKLTERADKTGQHTIDIEDANLQRLLSRLLLVDALAGQVDRNMGNFYINIQNGKVVAITGIDNDMAFGAKRRTFGQVYSFPGLSQFVDADLARSILRLDPTVLEAAMMDLLTTEEIDALIDRLKQLQDYLKDLESKNKLLERNQWGKATAQGAFNEDSSYYAKARQLYSKAQAH